MTITTVIEPFSGNDLSHLRTLFASYFPVGDKLLTDEYNNWLYGENPFGRALMVKVLEDQEWVGFMAMIPVTLTRCGEIMSAYYVVNVLVHPHFHGKHLFSKMIKAAMQHVEKEGAALLGHPNDMALKAWQRARMHFHEPLRPSLALPRPWALNIRSWQVRSADQLELFRDGLQTLLLKSNFWKVAATPEYINWRFLRHPANVYRLNVIEKGDDFYGIQVTRRMKPGVNMLIDQYVAEEALKLSTGKLPVSSICFLPDTAINMPDSGKLPLPLKKRIPFFLTNTVVPVDSVATSALGLSASDF